MPSQRNDLILLITDHVSGQLKKKDSEDLLASIKKNGALQNELRNQELLRQRLLQFKPQSAPKSLRESILQNIQSEEKNPTQKSSGTARLLYVGVALAAAASLILGIIFNSEIFQPASNTPVPVQIASLEQHLFDLFQSEMPQAPLHEFHNHERLHQWIKDRMSWDLTIPPVQNAELMGLSFTHTQSGDSVPVFLFSLPDEQPFMVIGAPFSELGSRNLRPHPEAIKACTSDDVYHVQNVNGKHVVSWKWGDDWYAGISNHDGKTISALLPH